MGVLQRFERRLEALVNGAFARIFRSAVQPVEIAAALQRELDNSAQILSRDASLVPNDFTVELSAGDYARLAPYAHTLSQELAEVVSRHASVQGYAFTGPVTVSFERREELSTGRFKLRSSAVAAVTPARRIGTTSGRRPSMPPGRPAGPAPAPGPGQFRGPQAGPVPGPPAPPYGRGPASTVPPPDLDRTQPLHRPPEPVYLEVNGARYPLDPPGLVLGRGSEADLRIADPGVSRRHAEIRVSLQGNEFEVSIHDLGSTNGIVIDGRRVDHATLDDGSQVLMGNTLLVVRKSGGRADEGGRPDLAPPGGR